jgi:hypothetical protein
MRGHGGEKRLQGKCHDREIEDQPERNSAYIHVSPRTVSVPECEVAQEHPSRYWPRHRAISVEVPIHVRERYERAPVARVGPAWPTIPRPGRPLELITTS